MLAFLMTVLLALPLICTTALASEGTGLKFTVNQKEEGYTYYLYQMFTGDVTVNPDYVEGTSSPDDKYIISNIKWGKSVPQATQEAMYGFYQLTGENRNAASFAEEMTKRASAGGNVFHDMMVEMARLNKVNGQSLEQGTLMAYDATAKNYSVSGLEPGYYFVMNTGVPNESASYSDYIIKIAGEDVTTEPKSSTVTAVKKVDDINQSTASIRTSNLDSSDANIGTVINYTLTSNLPGNFDAYKKAGAKPFRLVFEDDMSKGLTWYKEGSQADGYATIQFGVDGAEIPVNFAKVANGTKVTIDGKETELNSDYGVDGQLWKLDIADLLTFAENNAVDRSSLTANTIITIKYRAILNNNVVTTNSGNPNKYRVVFEANPNSPSESLSATEKDMNIVFTYKVTFNKIDEDNHALKGADFKLEKFVANSSGGTTLSLGGADVKGNWTDVTNLNTDTGFNPIKTASGDDSNNPTSFTFTGLDDGHYRLTETTVPVGYNKVKDLEFDITATHANDPEPRLTALNGTFTNWTDANNKDIELTASIPSASLTANIQNKRGIVLPASGGMGTTVLYVGGAVLVVGSVVALVIKRRVQE